MQLIAGSIGCIAYAFLIAGILRSRVEQSFAAFLLWGLLDSIAAITTILEHGNFWLALSNAAGSAVVAMVLIRKKQIAWSRVESVTALLVAVCLGSWYGAGETAGIIASSLAVVIASIPQMKDTFQHPADTPKFTYALFLTANVVSFFGGQDWSMKERFYPACSVFLTVVILGFAFRKPA